MPVYQVQTLTPDGDLREEALEARSERDLRQRLEARGQIPLSVRRNQPERSGTRRRGASAAAVEQFTQELEYLLDAGVGLEKALTLLSQQNALSTQLPLSELLDSIRKGQTFSQALAGWPALFDGLYVSMVQAAEATGNLADGMALISRYQQQSRQLRETVSSALIYPMILAAVSLVSVLVILLFVIPQFAEILAGMQSTLPFHTQLILDASAALRTEGHYYALALLTVLLVFRLFRHHPALSGSLDRLRLRLPVIGPLQIQIELARLCRSLGTLLSKGVPLLEAMQIARQTLTSPLLAQNFAMISQQLRDGQPFADTLARTAAIPELMTQLVRVGEETGRAGPMLLKLAEIYERQTTTRLRKLVSLLEPVLIISLGLVIAVLVLSMLSAIVGMNNLSF